MASILGTVSAQFTHNIFKRLDFGQRGFLDRWTLSTVLDELSPQQLNLLMAYLDKDGDARVTPHELQLTIFDWLGAYTPGEAPVGFVSLVNHYGVPET